MIPGLSAIPILMGAREEELLVENVFSTDIQTTPASSVVNGINFNKGGLIWQRIRNFSTDFHLQDTVRGAGNSILSNSTAAEASGNSITSFNDDGFTPFNWGGGRDIVYWSFRNAKRFFDVREVSHTNGVATNVDLSGLGAIGLAFAKITSAVGDWYSWHRSLTSGYNLRLHNNTAESNTNAYVSVSGTTLTISASAATGTYYIQGHAHDTAGDGVVQCVSMSTDGSGNGSYAHGWAGVQFAMLKCASTTGDWEMFDLARSPSWTTDLRLRANLQDVEDTVTRISDSGGTVSFTGLSASQDYILMLIRAEA